MEPVSVKERPNAADIHVGRRVRALRKAARLSLAEMAESIGVTYQQLHKYETGSNRISAGMLCNIALTLGCRIEALFAGISGLAEAGSPGVADLDRVLGCAGGRELLEAFVQMPQPLQRQVSSLAIAIVREPAPALRRPPVMWNPTG